MNIDVCNKECDYMKDALLLFERGVLNKDHLNGISVWIGASKNDKTSIETKNLYKCVLEKLGVNILACDFDAILDGRQNCDAILMFTITAGTSARAIEIVTTSKYEKKYKLADKLYVYMPKEYEEGYISRKLSNTLIAGKIFYKEEIQFQELNSNIFKKCITHLMTISNDRRREMEITFNPTILIVTALPKEFDMMVSLLEEERLDENLKAKKTHYPHGKIGNKDVVIAMSGMGNDFSSAITTFAITTYPSIETIFVTGIAGGVPYLDKPKEHVRLGDIVLSNGQGVIQYDMGKSTANGFEYNYPPRPPYSVVLKNAELLVQRTKYGEYKYWKYLDKLISKDPIENSRPEKGILRDSPWLKNSEIEQPKLPEGYSEDRPRIHFSPIASGNQVIKESNVRDDLKEKFNIKAVEMEAAGVADAAWIEDKSFFIIRGICDYANTDKNKIWQEYAAAAAAAFTYELIETL